MNIWRSKPPGPPVPPAEPDQPPGTVLDASGTPTTGGPAPAAVVLAPDGQPAAAAEMPFLDHLEELRWHI
ncbi:MAG TPA: hypothetical protein VF594_03785, partial [Rubricoccaceae bacterium]